MRISMLLELRKSLQEKEKMCAPLAGSMPPNSKRLVEEGAAIISFKLVQDGAFQVDAAFTEHGILGLSLQGSQKP